MTFSQPHIKPNFFNQVDNVKHVFQDQNSYKLQYENYTKFHFFP